MNNSEYKIYYNIILLWRYVVVVKTTDEKKMVEIGDGIYLDLHILWLAYNIVTSRRIH